MHPIGTNSPGKKQPLTSLKIGRPKTQVGKCSTKGCKGEASSCRRCRRCYHYLYHRGLRGKQIAAATLEWGKECCFKMCDAFADDRFSTENFPLCSYHGQCVQAMYWLEGRGYLREQLPLDLYWLNARDYAEMREQTEPENKYLYDKIRGETPLFKIFMDCYAFYLPFLHSL